MVVRLDVRQARNPGTCGTQVSRDSDRIRRLSRSQSVRLSDRYGEQRQTNRPNDELFAGIRTVVAARAWHPGLCLWHEGKSWIPTGACPRAFVPGVGMTHGGQSTRGVKVTWLRSDAHRAELWRFLQAHPFSTQAHPFSTRVRTTGANNASHLRGVSRERASRAPRSGPQDPAAERYRLLCQRGAGASVLSRG